jgi:HSP20 family protein
MNTLTKKPIYSGYYSPIHNVRNMIDFMDNLLSPIHYNTDHSAFVPKINVIENDNEFLIEVAAPGFTKENFSLHTENNILSINGSVKKETEEEKTNFKIKEFSTHSFKRNFQLPEQIVKDEISANYVNGILKIKLPKVKAEEKQTIKTILIQ